MPANYTLEDYMTGNTCETIMECLSFLYQEPESRRHNNYRVSIVFGRGSKQICVGDDLELANPRTNKVPKKRWWQHIEKAADQRRLPFPLYQPAVVVAVSTTRYGDEYELTVRFSEGDEGSERLISTTFTARRGLNAGGNSIKAIKIHRLCEVELDFATEMVNAPSPFLECYHRPTPPSPRHEPSTVPCVELIGQAIQNGLIVTRCSDVYDRLTGQHIGRNLTTREETSLSPPGRSYIREEPMYRCELIGDDGERYQFRISGDGIQYIDSDIYEGGMARRPWVAEDPEAPSRRDESSPHRYITEDDMQAMTRNYQAFSRLNMGSFRSGGGGSRISARRGDLTACPTNPDRYVPTDSEIEARAAEVRRWRDSDLTPEPNDDNAD